MSGPSERPSIFVGRLVTRRPAIAGVMSRQRELFPLPLPHSRSRDSSHDQFGHQPCRSVRRRLLRRSRGLDWCGEGVAALNELSGYPFSSPPGEARNLRNQ